MNNFFLVTDTLDNCKHDQPQLKNKKAKLVFHSVQHSGHLTCTGSFFLIMFTINQKFTDQKKNSSNVAKFTGKMRIAVNMIF